MRVSVCTCVCVCMLARVCVCVYACTSVCLIAERIGCYCECILHLLVSRSILKNSIDADTQCVLCTMLFSLEGGDTEGPVIGRRA